MNPFQFLRATNEADAVRLSTQSNSLFLGGGTSVVDLMRETILTPNHVVDVSRLSADIAEQENGSVLIGAAAKNTAVTEHPIIRARYPVLAKALLSGAYYQIRNMATVAGNLMQRTRCAYFYDRDAARCNKRHPGAGCDAIGSFERGQAILGTSDHCIAVSPSDMCVALAALAAVIHVLGPSGARTIAFDDFHRLPGETPHLDFNIGPDELITAIELPAFPYSSNSGYLKARDRTSYAFALVSVAAALELEGAGVKNVRLAFGGIGTKPWRAFKTERELMGKSLSDANIENALEVELGGARIVKDTAYKVPLLRRLTTGVLSQLREAAS